MSDLCVGVRPRKKRRQTRRMKVTVQQTYAAAPTAEMDTAISSSEFSIVTTSGH